jgi:hypothetical protein
VYLTTSLTIEELHAYLRGIGAKFSVDRFSDVLPQIKNYNRLMAREGKE